MRRAHLAIFVAALLSAPSAQAELYQAVDLSQVSQEEDLRDLAAQGDLEASDVDLLIELLLDPININRARRDALYQLPSLTYDHVDAILAYRAEKGRFESIDQLLEVEGITPDIYIQLAPFAVALAPLIERVETTGSLKARAAYTTGGRPIEGREDEIRANNDDVLRAEGFDPIPEAYVRGRAAIGSDIDVGLVLMEQANVGAWAYNPNDMAFDIRWGQPVYSFEKAYVQLNKDNYTAIFGSYSAGFGQRLVFDNSQRNRPNGFYKDDRVNNSFDFSAPERNFGAAITLDPRELGSVSLGGTAFASYQRHDLYETRFAVNPPDGVEYGELAYGASVASILPSGAELPYVTYPNLYAEALFGFHADLTFSARHRVGLTAYGAAIRKNAPVFFTNAIPDRPFFGAIGLDFQTGFAQWDAAGEIAVMDSGGLGTIVRAARGGSQGEVVISGRHYGTDFDNPHSRAQAQPGVYSVSRPDSRSTGDPPFDPDLYTSYDRDRDEQGFRVEGYHKPRKWLRLTAYADGWRAPSTGLWNADVQTRADFQIKKIAEWDVLLRYQDRVLSQYGRARSFGDDTGCDPNDPDFGDQCGGSTDEAIDEAAGSKITAGTYLTFRAIPLTTVYLSYRRFYEDDRRLYILADCYSEQYYFRIGHVAAIKTTTQLPLGLRSTLRVRLQDDDVYGASPSPQWDDFGRDKTGEPFDPGGSGERTLSAYGQLEWVQPSGRWKISGRYTVDTALRNQADKDYIRCACEGDLPEDPAERPALERSRTPVQSILATVETRF